MGCGAEKPHRQQDAPLLLEKRHLLTLITLSCTLRKRRTALKSHVLQHWDCMTRALLSNWRSQCLGKVQSWTLWFRHWSSSSNFWDTSESEFEQVGTWNPSNCWNGNRGVGLAPRFYSSPSLDGVGRLQRPVLEDTGVLRSVRRRNELRHPRWTVSHPLAVDGETCCVEEIVLKFTRAGERSMTHLFSLQEQT